jgi:hypothetical protein
MVSIVSVDCMQSIRKREYSLAASTYTPPVEKPNFQRFNHVMNRLRLCWDIEIRHNFSFSLCLHSKNWSVVLKLIVAQKQCLGKFRFNTSKCLYESETTLLSMKTTLLSVKTTLRLSYRVLEMTRKKILDFLLKPLFL